jgi:hypothetical protein
VTLDTTQAVRLAGKLIEAAGRRLPWRWRGGARQVRAVYLIGSARSPGGA